MAFVMAAGKASQRESHLNGGWSVCSLESLQSCVAFLWAGAVLGMGHSSKKTDEALVPTSQQGELRTQDGTCHCRWLSRQKP